MRFSSVFQHPAAPSQPTAATAERRAAEAAAESTTPPAAAQQLPDELDARVRLLGEWQLGEAD